MVLSSFFELIHHSYIVIFFWYLSLILLKILVKCMGHFRFFHLAHAPYLILQYLIARKRWKAIFVSLCFIFYTKGLNLKLSGFRSSHMPNNTCHLQIIKYHNFTKISAHSLNGSVPQFILQDCRSVPPFETSSAVHQWFTEMSSKSEDVQSNLSVIIEKE